MLYYFSKNYKETTSAGNKAKRDIESTLHNYGYQKLGLAPSYHSNIVLSFILTLCSVVVALIKVQRNDVLFVQYPLKKYYRTMCKVANIKGAKTITLIHDIGSFRRRKLSVSKEIRQLNKTASIIAHNENMKRWLLENGCSVPIICLGIFDYLSHTKAQPRTSSSDNIHVVYAGGLSSRKNSFLYEVGAYAKNYSYQLYGNGFDIDNAKKAEAFDYRGFVLSDTLIECAEGDYGLVWDGDSVDECSGAWGEYLRYNNPHKASLYIRCELPLIVWRESALADFVTTNGIGICVDSLKELDARLPAITTTEYADMKSKVAEMSRRLSEGYYFINAVEAAMSAI